MIDQDYNFELLPSAAASSGMPFGIGQHVSLDENGFIPGSTDWVSQDVQDSQTGVTHFGRDVITGPTWQWQLHVNRSSPEEAIETLDAFRAAWHISRRLGPGENVPLRYKVGGRTRRVYGRPRRFEAPPNNKILSGYVPVSVDFKCVDAFTYDDEMKTVSMLLGEDFVDPDAGDSGGGFVFPLLFPHVSLPPTRQQVQVEVGGIAETAPIIRFHGPVANPAIVTDEFTIGLRDYFIPEGQYVEIDCRPWRATALLNGNASVAGMLTRRTRLTQVRFWPGRFEARYLGSSSGSSLCEISWAPASESL